MGDSYSIEIGLAFISSLTIRLLIKVLKPFAFHIIINILCLNVPLAMFSISPIYVHFSFLPLGKIEYFFKKFPFHLPLVY